MQMQNNEWLPLDLAADHFGYAHKESLRRRLRQLRERGLVCDIGRPPAAYEKSEQIEERTDYNHVAQSKNRSSKSRCAAGVARGKTWSSGRQQKVISRLLSSNSTKSLARFLTRRADPFHDHFHEGSTASGVGEWF